MLDRNIISQEYGYLKDVIFLNVSSVVMPPKRVQDAYNSFMPTYIRNYGEDIVSRAWAIVNETRPKVARLINAEYPHEIAFVKNTCEGISIIADGFPFKAGDNVILADQEHQANLFPWINLHERKGVSLKVIKSENGEISCQKMVEAIDNKTRILTISSAQFSTGFAADLKFLGSECKKRGILFVVDGIQTLGRLKIDVQECHIDYLAAGSNKGLLGTLGAGIIYCSDRIVKDIIPPYASYQSVVSHVSPPAITTNFENLEWYPHARRFESGNLSYNCILAISKGLDLILELGIENIDPHVRELEAHLRSLISDLPLHVVQAVDPKNWSGIVCVYYPACVESEVVRILHDYKIYSTMRGGYMRFGIDFYNTLEQMDVLSEALHRIAKLSNN